MKNEQKLKVFYKFDNNEKSIEDKIGECFSVFLMSKNLEKTQKECNENFKEGRENANNKREI